MDNKLNNYIANSNVRLKQGEHWWSFNAQKQYIFAIAKTLMIEYDYSPQDAIDTAQDFINRFHNTIHTGKPDETK